MIFYLRYLSESKKSIALDELIEHIGTIKRHKKGTKLLILNAILFRLEFIGTY